MRLRAQRPVHGGYTIARTEQGIVLLEGAAPGELVEAEIDETARPARARVTKVLEPSAERVDHIWPDAGGVELGYLSEKAQRDWKTEVVADAIAHLGGGLAGHLSDRGITPVVTPIGPGGRTRLEVTITDGRPAMNRRGSTELVPFETMPLATDRLNSLLSGSWIETVRDGQRVRLVDPSGSEPVVVAGDTMMYSDGRPAPPRVIERVNDMTWQVSASGFWQTHSQAPATLINAVLRGTRLRASDRVAEFYGGAGLLTLPLARGAASVRMWEGSGTAVRDAQRNVPEAEVRKAMINPAVLIEGSKGADVVVADPSRQGLGVKGALALASSDAVAIALVSCDPAAMARDVSTMVGAGRSVMTMEALDLFPGTMHVEVVTLLS